MTALPYFFIEPLQWWLFKAPKKIFMVAKRVIVMVDNQISFILNIRLLFVPLFGDYTLPGRFIGFVIRVFQIVFGFILMVFLLIITILLPVLWWLLPLIILYHWGFWVIPIFTILLYVHTLAVKNIPQRRISQVSDDKIKLSFRPNVKKYLEALSSNTGTSFLDLLKEEKVVFLLRKSELYDKGFENEVSRLSEKNDLVLDRASFELARKQGSRYVELEQLFCAYISGLEGVEQLLVRLDSSVEILEEAAEWIVNEREELSRVYFWQDDYEYGGMGGIGKGMTGRVTPLLDSISEDYTGLAKKGRIKKVVAHTSLIEEVAEMLSSGKDDILIIGPPGCGKTSVVKEIARRIIAGTSYKTLQNKRIVKVDAGSLVTGAKTPGELSENIKKVMEEVTGSNDIILFIDEIHNLSTSMGESDTQVASAYSILEPYISSEGVRVIGATNIENYRKYVEPNGAFARLFHLVEVPQASDAQTLAVLKSVSRDMEETKKVFITLPALRRVIFLSNKLIHDRVHPDKGIDILSRAIASVNSTTRVVDSKLIEQQVSLLTKIPVSVVTEDESQKLLNLENEMKQSVIGQDHAIDQVAKALKRARAGVRDEGKPIASFLFVGTTGVGKTETAKTLAKIYFGDEDSMIRLDMSEYQQIDSMNRLIGSPDGKVKGALTEAVRTKPFSLILLDELEKAYSSILLTFLQVLDDGRITDSLGRTYDFTNTIIIATSNVGTREIQEVTQQRGDFVQMQTAVNKKVQEHFAPEFLNRFNGIIVFNPLTKENVKAIARIILKRVERMTAEKGIKVSFKEELIDALADKGYSPEWGARPLSRVIEENVETYLAVKMLAKEINRGDVLTLGTEVFGSDTIS
ncbi:MAG: ATP-dependent Clp protease ATP-binding subunit [Patescibacteria group bacterium]|jgi:ATP-dependent Clp protease ATP-binding subunit ClpA